MNLQELRAELLVETQSEKNVLLLGETETDILTDDLVELKRINYHVVPPTAEWLISKLYWGPSLEKEHTPDRDRAIAKLLMFTDPNMLITLNAIFIVGASEEDADFMSDVATELLEESDPVEPPQYSEHLGVYWSYPTSVIINVDVLRECAAEVCQGLPAMVIPEEERAAFITTLFHEIRHLGMANPFLPEDEYPDSECDERTVEAWALSEYGRYAHTHR